MVKIAVVGAGTPGMSTAVCIKQALPYADVTVVSAGFTKDTTSHGAGGIFRVSDVPHERYRQWLKDSWKFYSSVASGPESCEAGVYFKSGYQFCKEPRIDYELGFLSVLPHWHALSATELQLFPNKPKYGYFYTTLITESKYFLPWLMKKFEKMGGKLVKRKLQSFSELAGIYDIVVNCAGYANKWLLNDNKLYPMRGQVFKVQMPWLKHFVYSDFVETYIFPGKDCVVVGGHRVSEPDNESLEVNPKHSQLIWENALKVLPSLKDAEVITEWAGLRPMRKDVRVETEKLNVGGKPLQMVHNYGHGSFGISIAWGTAVEATELVKQLLATSSKL